MFPAWSRSYEKFNVTYVSSYSRDCFPSNVSRAPFESSGASSPAVNESSSTMRLDERREENGPGDSGELCQRQYKSWEGLAGLEVVNIIC